MGSLSSLSALFKVTAFTEDEKTSHIFRGDSVHECIASADNWAANREGIWHTLNLLETSTEVTVCEPTLSLEYHN